MAVQGAGTHCTGGAGLVLLWQCRAVVHTALVVLVWYCYCSAGRWVEIMLVNCAKCQFVFSLSTVWI
jgi:hypothetical protein